MPGYNNLRHIAAAKAAYEQTRELQETVDKLELQLADAKVAWGKAHNEVYHRTYDELKA